MHNFRIRCSRAPCNLAYIFYPQRHSTMKSVAVAAFLALAATADGFVVSPASTCATRTASAATSQPTSFMSRRVVGAPVASTGAIKMSDSMNDAQQPTLEQVTEADSLDLWLYSIIMLASQQGGTDACVCMCMIHLLSALFRPRRYVEFGIDCE